MLSFVGIKRNFRLMVIHVRKQLEGTLQLLDQPSARLIRDIQHADDYIDTQKSMIENECYDLLSRHRIEEERDVDFIRALTTITVNLERIADFSANIARQTPHLTDFSILRRYDYRAYIDRLLEGLDSVSDALFERDASLALRIGYIEDELDRLYRGQLQQIIESLRNTQHVENFLTVMFILHYLERMGDALKNIGEAIILAALGERLKIHQFRVLDEALESNTALRESITDVELASIWGTRSGVRVGTIADLDTAARGAQRVVFKEGRPGKLQRERESLKRWAEVAPGLAPSVVEYKEQERGAALLLQYLDGTTLQDIALNADPQIIAKALHRLEATLRDIWTRTLQPQRVNGEYLQQLASRIDDVYRLHPELRGEVVHIGALRVPPFPELLEQAGHCEAELDAPCTVFIHGDFNIDNIIYDLRNDCLHLVDTHRSRDMDYVQDVSVFLVSNFRLPIFARRMRQTLEAMTLRFLRFARAFAAEHADQTFEARLALGLVRSFVTSTRFELNQRFARQMHQRAILLLDELVRHHGRPWPEFRLPDDVLVY